MGLLGQGSVVKRRQEMTLNLPQSVPGGLGDGLYPSGLLEGRKTPAAILPKLFQRRWRSCVIFGWHDECGHEFPPLFVRGSGYDDLAYRWVGRWYQKS